MVPIAHGTVKKGCRSIADGRTWGAEIGALSQELIDLLRRRVVTAPWGQERRWKCVEVFLAPCVMGHRIDPWMAGAYRTEDTADKIAERVAWVQ